jgi:hypothetical protein
MANNGCASSPFFLLFAFRPGAERRKCLQTKEIKPSQLAKRSLLTVAIHQTSEYNRGMKDQINPQPILCVLGFFIVVCLVAVLALLVQEIAFLFAV